jgi:hypothetical protein
MKIYSSFNLKTAVYDKYVKFLWLFSVSYRWQGPTILLRTDRVLCVWSTIICGDVFIPKKIVKFDLEVFFNDIKNIKLIRCYPFYGTYLPKKTDFFILKFCLTHQVVKVCFCLSFFIDF